MADRYWVGGSGTWDSSSTTNWSATSGGAAGASAPTSVDDAYFNASSGSPTVTMSGAVCRSFSHAAGTATFSGDVTMYGGLTFSANTTISSASTFLFSAASSSWTINTAGRSLNGSTVYIGTGSSTATWTLGSALNNVYLLRIATGTFSTSASNYAITYQDNFSFSNKGIEIDNGSSTSPGSNITVSLNGSTITMPLFYATAFTSSTLTLNLGTSKINCSDVRLFALTSTSYSPGTLAITSSSGQEFIQDDLFGPFGFYFYGNSSAALGGINGFYNCNLYSYSGSATVKALVFANNNSSLIINNSANFTQFVVVGGGIFPSGTGTISFTGAITANPVSALSLNFDGTISCVAGTFTSSAAVNLPPSGNFQGGILSVPNGTTATFTGASGTATLQTVNLASGGILDMGASTAHSIANLNVIGTLQLSTSTTTVTTSMVVNASATITPATSTLNFNPPNLNTLCDFYHAGKTYNNITVNGSQVRFIGTASPTLTCANFTRTGAADVYSFLQLNNTNITASGTITLTGNSLTNRTFVYGSTEGSQQTLTASTRSLTNVDLRNIAGAGGSLPWGAGTSVGDVGNNTNITFTPAVTRYARGSGAWDSTTVWSATSGGATGATVPLAQDDVQFNSGSGAVNVTTGTRRFLCRNLAISNFTGTLTANAGTASSNQISFNQILGDLTLDPSSTIVGSGGSICFTKVGTVSALIVNNVTSILTFRPTVATSLNIGNYQLDGVGLLSGLLTLACTGGTIKSFIPSFGLTNSDTYYLASVTTPPTVSFVNTSTLNTNQIQVTTATNGTETINYTVNSAYSQIISGKFYNVVFSNTTDSTIPTITSSFEIVNSFTTAPSTLRARFSGTITCSGNGRFTAGSFTAPMYISNVSFVNNSVFAQETQYAYYDNTVVTGTNPDVRAFGATNVTANTGITFPSPLKVAAFSNFAGSWQVPNDFGGTFQVFSVGGGGQATVPSSGFASSGGAGAGGIGVTYGISGVLRNSTVYVNAASSTGKNTGIGSGASGGVSWLNVSANTLPTVAVGSVGYGGTALGSRGSAVGTYTLTTGSSGGFGAFSTTAGGGGGGGGSTFVYGQLPTANCAGGNGSTSFLGGGGGGTSGSASGTTGGPPNGGSTGNNGGVGGGGGGGTSGGSGGNGGNSTNWTYNYLNGVASSGTIGVGGAGGGSGTQIGASRVVGGDGGIGAGGGGVGYYNSATNPYGGSGGAGLVLFVYAVRIEDTSAQFIG